MTKRMNDADYCEKICRLEGEVAMIEESLVNNRNPFQRKQYQSLLYEKKKQLNRANSNYTNFIKKHNIV